GKVWEGPSLKELLKQQHQQHSTSAAAPAPASPEAAPSNVEPVSPDDLPRAWKALLTVLAKHGPGLHGLLSHGRLVAIDDGRAVIRYGRQHETFVKMLEKNGKKEIVRDAMSQVLSQPIGVKFE